VVITVYKDKSFSFITKQPPSSSLIKKALNLASGSKEPNKIKVGKLTKQQIKDIAARKMKDLNARTEAAAIKIIAGTARQMGVDVEA
jgi:large subunit ribosomal protein L11